MDVLSRDRYERQIIVACPKCSGRCTLGPALVTKLDDGHVINGACPACQHRFDVSITDLGGFLWDAPPAKS